MKVIIDYKFESMNKYIYSCRANPYYANQIKQKETRIAKMHFLKIPKITDYPVEIIFKWHIKNKTTDLDGKGAATKNIIDGLREAKVIEEDTVKHISKIMHEYVEDTKDYVEVELIESKSII